MSDKCMHCRGHKKGVSEKEVYSAYKLFFNTFASEQRLKILNLLRKNSMNVSEIIDATGFEQTVVSHNLRRLRSCGFIALTQKGKYRYYSLNSKTINAILNLIDTHMDEHCLKIIKGLKNES